MFFLKIKKGMEECRDGFEKGYRIAYLVVAIICNILTSIQLMESNQITETVALITLVLTIGSICYLQKTNFDPGKYFPKIIEKVCLFFLEICAMFSFTGLYFYEKTATHFISYPRFVWGVMTFIWVRPIVLCLVSLMINKVNRLEEPRTISWKYKILMALGIMLPLVLALIAFNPAITTVDSEKCFLMANSLFEGEPISDWHPPFYIFMIWLLTKLCNSITFLIVLQGVCFTIVFVDILCFFLKCGVPKKIVIFSYLFVAFNISNVIELTTFWKDIPYTISLIWITSLLIKIIIKPETYGISWSIQYVFAIVFVSFFRQNGILPAIIILVAIPFVIRKKTILVSTVICICLIVLIRGPLYQSMGVERVPQMKFFALSNDLIYTYKYGGDVDADAMEIINKVTKNDPNNYEFSEYRVYFNTRQPSGYSIVEFLWIYMKNAVRNPQLVFDAVMTRNTYVWSIPRPKDEIVRFANYVGEQNVEDEQMYPFRERNVMTFLGEQVSKYVEGSILYLIYWRTAEYSLWILAGMVCIFPLKSKKTRMKDRFIFFVKKYLPYIPVVFNLVGVFVTAAAANYRYVWPSMVLSVVLWMYFMVIKQGELQ